MLRAGDTMTNHKHKASIFKGSNEGDRQTGNFNRQENSMMILTFHVETGRNISLLLKK